MATPDILDLDHRPLSRRRFLADLWRHRDVAYELARTDFQMRFKRAAFGILWALAVPLSQAAIIAIVFSRVAKLGGGDFNYPVYVLSGVVAWSFFQLAFQNGATAIVDGTQLASKVWFPRIILPAIPAAGNLVGLGASVLAMLLVMPLLGDPITLELLYLLPGIALLIAFVVCLSSLTAVLHVYYRDLRYLVQAAMLVWFYGTPVIYPARLLPKFGAYFDFNPVTGIIDLFHVATLGHAATHAANAPGASISRAVLVSVIATVVCALASIELYRRRDREVSDLI
jgi:lipopolysaccharide transport system permease protein